MNLPQTLTEKFNKTHILFIGLKAYDVNFNRPSDEYLKRYHYYLEENRMVKLNATYAPIVKKETIRRYKFLLRTWRTKLYYIYGKCINFESDSLIMGMSVKINEIMKETNTEIKEMLFDIRKYVGYNIPSIRFDNNISTPIEPSRIEKAWHQVRNRESFINIENTLML